jgi:general nucleoside transport system permease protein
MQEALKAIFTFTFIASVFRITTPILLPALGGLLTDLGGSINVALEGMMLLAAFTGPLVSNKTQSGFVGMVAGVVVAMLAAALLAFVHLNLGADIVLAGLALNIFASGGTVFLLFKILHDKGSSSTLETKKLPFWDIPLLDRIPGVKQIISGQHVLTYAAFVLIFVTAFYLYRTKWGLRLRAVGENADAAATAGISVIGARYSAVILSGLLAGLGGVFLSMGQNGQFVRDMTAGRGFIALGAVLLGGRTPYGTALAALLFGAADALANQLKPVHALQDYAQLVSVIPNVITIVALVVYAQRQKTQQARRARRYREQQALAEPSAPILTADGD